MREIPIRSSESGWQRIDMQQMITKPIQDQETTRAIVFAEIVAVGCLCLAASQHQASSTSSLDTVFLAALLLVVACVGFLMKLLGRWSTRLVWEWIFVGATLLGGWTLPRVLIPGSLGSFVSAFVLFAPLVSQAFELSVFVSVIGVSGAALLLAGYIPSSPLWVLWLGLAVYDHVAFRMLESTSTVLQKLTERRRIVTSLPVPHTAHVRILLSHLVLPGALILQAARRDFRQGLILFGALLIGSAYAMMRPKEDRVALIVPWVALWMAGAEVLMNIVHR